MPNSARPPQGDITSFGIAPRPRDAKLIALEVVAILWFGIAPRPRDAKLIMPATLTPDLVWDCPPSKGCQTARVAHPIDVHEFGIAPRPRDAKLCHCVQHDQSSLGLPPVQGMPNSRLKSDCARFLFGIAPRPRDAKLATISASRAIEFGIAPRPRDAKLPATSWMSDTVWDCPPSKGCQTYTLQYLSVGRSLGLPPVQGMPNYRRQVLLGDHGFGIAPRPRDAKLIVRRCRMHRVAFGIAPRPRDAKLSDLMVVSASPVWDCPPSKGCQTE